MFDCSGTQIGHPEVWDEGAVSGSAWDNDQTSYRNIGSLEPPDFYRTLLQVCGRSLEVRD